jgi:hypothetical protein
MIDSLDGDTIPVIPMDVLRRAGEVEHRRAHSRYVGEQTDERLWCRVELLLSTTRLIRPTLRPLTPVTLATSSAAR